MLFDIDGTLLDTGGAGLRALRGAFLDFFGIGPDRHGEFPVLDLAGSTDGGILRGFSIISAGLGAKIGRAVFTSFTTSGWRSS